MHVLYTVKDSAVKLKDCRKRFSSSAISYKPLKLSVDENAEGNLVFHVLNTTERTKSIHLIHTLVGAKIEIAKYILLFLLEQIYNIIFNINNNS